MRCGRVAALAMGLFGPISACGEAGSAVESSTSRDSAGIVIVESSRPAWQAGEAWHLDGAPLLDLGRLDGPEETQFFGVSSGTRLSDGSIVVGSFRTHDLRRFTARGEHLWTVGREGDGPGEFAGLMQLVASPGDTLLTYDFRQRRISRFTPDGQLLESWPLESSGENGIAFVESLLPDGRAVFTLRVFGRVQDEIILQAAPSRPEFRIGISGAPGDPVVDIGRFPGPEMVVLRQGETDEGFNIMIGSPAFGRSTEIAADESGVWIGDTERYEIRRYGTEGTLEAIVRRRFEPVPADDALIRTAMQEELEEADDDEERRMIRKRWEEVPVPSTLPAYEGVMVDRGSNVWVQSFQIPGASQRVWSVFTREGIWLGDVEVPDRFRPLEIGDDYVLGRFGDELDVEHVQLWKLIKPAG